MKRKSNKESFFLRCEYLNCLREILSIKKRVSSSITFTMINKYGKGAVVKNTRVFVPVYHVA